MTYLAENPELRRARMREYMRWYRSDEQVLRREREYLRECARLLQTRAVSKRLANKLAKLVKDG